MHQYCFILGRDPLLSIAELDNFLSKQFSIQSIIHPNLLFISSKTPISSAQNFLNHLGGTKKIIEILTPNKTKYPIQENTINSLFPKLLTTQSGKIPFGVSIENLHQNPKLYLNLTLNLIKKILKSKNINSRFINSPLKNPTIAQIIHNKTLKKGFELTLINTQQNTKKNKPEFLIGKTLAIQNIEHYSKRDFKRPNRNTQNGILPPKLAQILINLSNPQNHKKPITIYDPFCGNGTILAESLLMNYDAIGSDISEKLISETNQNLNWLKQNFSNQINQNCQFETFTADATSLPKSIFSKPITAIISETWLGPTFSSFPQKKEIYKTQHQINKLMHNFFTQLKNFQPKTPIIICLPAYQKQKNQTIIFKQTINTIEQLGFKLQPLISNQTSKILNLTPPKTLIYSRPNQIVARQILKLQQQT